MLYLKKQTYVVYFLCIFFYMSVAKTLFCQGVTAIYEPHWIIIMIGTENCGND